MFELLPHLTRLVPMADRYLTTRSASEKAQEAALVALGEQVRSDLRGLDQSRSGLQLQLQEQSQQLADVASQTARARIALETMESRVTGLESAAAEAKRLLLVVLVLGVVAIGLLTFVLVRLRGL